MLRSIVVLIAALLVAAVPVAAQDAPTLRLAMLGDLHTLNPILVSQADETALLNSVFLQLVDYDADGHPHPRLATEVPTRANGGISADGTTITVHLKPGVRWQDGEPVTSADVAFTVHTVLDPSHAVSNRSLYEGIAAVETPNATTVRFRLKQPDAGFIADVLAGYPPVPAHLLAKSSNLETDPFNAAPIGDGPYKFVRWDRGDRIVLAADPAYRGPAPYFSRVEFRVIADSNTIAIALRKREVDFSAIESSMYHSLADATDVKRVIEPFNDFVSFAINQERPLLRDVRVRRAISLAIDRRGIVERVTFGTGTPAYADLPLFMYGGHAPDGFDRAHLAQAAALLDAAGWKTGSDGIRVKDGQPLHLTYIDFSGSATGATSRLLIQQMLRSVGIDMEIKSYVPSIYFSPASAGGPLNKGDFDLGVVTFVAGPDPTNGEIYRCSGRAPSGNNSARYCNPAMERLQDAASREYDPARRNALVQKIEDLAATDVPYVFVYHTPLRLAMRSDLRRPPGGLDGYWHHLEEWSLAR